MSSGAKTFLVWRMPIALAALVLFGLLDALLIDNFLARVIAWLVLAVPIILAVRSIAGARSSILPKSGDRSGK